MKYNFYEKAVISVVNDFKAKYKNFAYVSNQERFQDFPVFLQTSGDETYMSVHSDRLSLRDKSDKVSLPMMALSFSGIGINEDNKTNEISDGKFVIELNGFKKSLVSEMSTYDTEIKMDAVVLFTDIFQYLAFVEYNMNGVYKAKPFYFEYFGKQQQGTWSLETTDHTVDMDVIGSFGSESVASHQEQLSFVINIPYPSFNLNDSLSQYVDGDGDGNNEGGVGIPSGAISTDNVIKGVVHYIDDTVEPNVMTKVNIGKEIPSNLDKTK